MELLSAASSVTPEEYPIRRLLCVLLDIAEVIEFLGYIVNEFVLPPASVFMALTYAYGYVPVVP
jgi:hypothetical protein